MADNAINNEGFNKGGFRDIELPDSLQTLNKKRLKIQQFCSKYCEKSEKKSDKVISKVSISEFVGETWNNLSFTLDELDLLIMRAPEIRKALLYAGGAFNAENHQQD